MVTAQIKVASDVIDGLKTEKADMETELKIREDAAAS